MYLVSRSVASTSIFVSSALENRFVRLSIMVLHKVLIPTEDGPFAYSINFRTDTLGIMHAAEDSELLISIVTSSIGTSVSIRLQTMSHCVADKQLIWPCPAVYTFSAHLCCLYNLMLATESIPENLSAARVAFIRKTDAPSHPSKYRPIAVISILTCALYKILVKRMRGELSFNKFQLAFLQRDGCLEASMLVHVALRKAHDGMHETSVIFLELAKVFDTVSHEAILRAALQAGIPQPLAKYMDCLYTNTVLYLTKTKVICARVSCDLQCSSFSPWMR